MQLTSSAPAPDSPIIRTGSDGRLRYSPEQRQTLLGAFDRGGQSALAFSKTHGVSYQTFITWLRKRREGGASLPPGFSPFAEVILEQAQPSSSSALRILLSCGTVIEVASRAALPLAAELLSTLRRPC